MIITATVNCLIKMSVSSVVTITATIARVTTVDLPVSGNCGRPRFVIYTPLIHIYHVKNIINNNNLSITFAAPFTS